MIGRRIVKYILIDSIRDLVLKLIIIFCPEISKKITGMMNSSISVNG